MATAPVNPITAAILAVIGSVGSLVVGLGIITNAQEGLVAAVAGTVVSLVLVVVNALHHKAAAIATVPAAKRAAKA